MMKKIMKNARQMRKKRDGWMDENPANEKCKPKKIDLNEKTMKNIIIIIVIDIGLCLEGKQIK